MSPSPPPDGNAPLPPLAGRRIVITRSEPDARPLAGRLEALGAVPVVVPSIAVEFMDPAQLDTALAAGGVYDWVIFTSRNAVEAVYRRPGRLAGPRIAAIGPATAAGLRAHGVDPDVTPPEHVAEAVVSALGDVKGLRILFPRAEIARRALPDGLRERGAIVDEVVVYRTTAPATARPGMEGVDAVTFTSPSTVNNFLDGGPIPAGAKVVCIGPTTARTARERGLHVTEVAGDYSEDGLIAALIAALGT